jgi:hypothetical protein
MSEGANHGLVDEDRVGVVVDDPAAFVDDPVVAVRCIGIERDVGEDADLRYRILDCLDRPADEVVGVERFPRVVGAKLVRRVREKRDARDAEARRLLCLGGDAVDAPAANARKRTDRLIAAGAFADEERQDEVAGVQPVLGEHVAHPRARPAAAHAKCWEG